MKDGSGKIQLIDKLIAIGVACLIAITLLIVYVWKTTEIHYNAKLEEIVLEQYKTKHIMTLNNIVRERLSTLTEMIFFNDPFDQYDAIEKFHVLGGRFIKEREKINFRSLSPGERLRWSLLRDLLTKGGRIQAEVVDKIEKQETNQAFAQLVNEVIPHQRKVIDTLSILADLQMEKSNLAIIEALEARKRRTYLIILFGILSILTAGLIITLVIRKKKAEDTITATNQRIRKLYEIATTPSLSTEDQIIEALRSVCESIGFDYAYITQVNYQDGICRMLYHTDQNINIGTTVPLRQSLCSISILSSEPTVILDMNQSLYNNHPAVIGGSINAYIGNPIFVNGMKYGLINYAAKNRVIKRVTKTEIECMILASDWIVSILSKELIRDHYLQSKAVEQATTIKNAVLSNINLDISTSIDSIAGLISQMREELKSSDMDAMENSLQSASLAVSDLRSFVNNFIDMKNIQTNSLELQSGLSDMQNIVSETANSLLPRIKANGNELVVLVDTNVGAVELDEIRYRQILVNLLLNANQHTRSGKIALSVYRDSVLGKNWMLTEVSDTGEGIESSRIPLLFVPFAESASGKQLTSQHARLGLSISEFLCKKMGGSLSVESKLGVGTTFTMTLPIHEFSLRASNE